MRLSLAFFATAALSLAACGGSNPSMAATDGGLSDMNIDTMQCDVLKQTGCPMGQHCTVGSIGKTHADLCIPNAQSPLAEGADCAPVMFGNLTGDDCATGLVCVTYGGLHQCRRLCGMRSDCQTTPTQYACVGPTFSPAAALACVPDDHCDPLKQTGCSAKLSCYFSPSDDVGRYTLCLTPSGKNLPFGGDCGAQIDCAPGSQCAGLGFCRSLCDLSAADGGVGSCPAAQGKCAMYPGYGSSIGLCQE